MSYIMNELAKYAHENTVDELLNNPYYLHDLLKNEFFDAVEEIAEIYEEQGYDDTDAKLFSEELAEQVGVNDYSRITRGMMTRNQILSNILLETGNELYDLANSIEEIEEDLEIC